MKATLLILFALCSSVLAEDLSVLCADRAAVERVYYNHRLGNKPPFEEVLPPSLIERLVKEDLHKEAVLKNIYGIAITPAMFETEVRRIHTTTRAPDVLAKLKAALGNDTNRFARTVAKPIVVERLLRERFDNDENLHAAQRHEAERMRNALLAAKRDGAGYAELLLLLKRNHSNSVSEITWQLAARPDEKPGTDNLDEIEIRKRFGPDAQILVSPRDRGGERKFYFAELPGELQHVLRAQLHQPGDVSAVIEIPDGFLLYVAKRITAGTWTVAMLSLPKLNYERWLAEQTGGEGSKAND